ncbi:MAG TPA: hypothetical protein VFQ60_03635 [Patescibacteria group bacterium]|nr:hypothetical protein [Patescibacteria group bacterium]
MPESLRVIWKPNEGHEDKTPLKGRILFDPETPPRKKLVLLDRLYHGDMPKPGEITLARVIKDTQLENPLKGTLFVEPIFASSRIQVKDPIQEMRNLIQTQQTFGRCFINVDLPGWKGVLQGTPPERPRPGPFSLRWEFHPEGEKPRSGRNRQNEFKIPFSKGVIGQYSKSPHWFGWLISDWTVALQDLGEPASIQDNKKWALVTWTNQEGESLTARIKAWFAFRYGIEFSDFMEQPDGTIRATRWLLGRRWKTERLWLIRESAINPESGILTVAGFNRDTDPNDPEVRSRVIEFIRAKLAT